MIVCSLGRATAFFKMRIGHHGVGVFDKAVPVDHSYGLTNDGKTVVPILNKAMGIASQGRGVWWNKIHHRTYP